MKSVMISILPEWVEKILSGEKTIEVRKTAPKIATPFKCYIYCTKDNTDRVPSRIWWKADKTGFQHILNGKVIGEFVCDFVVRYEAELWDDDTFERITEVYEPDDFAEYGEYEHKTIADNGDDFWKDNMLCKASCVSIEELRKYIGTGFHQFYGWHISDLKTYDKPKDFREFFSPCEKTKYPYCFDCEHGLQAGEERPLPGMRYYDVPCGNWLKRPPQSWCYVEELKEVACSEQKK